MSLSDYKKIDVEISEQPLPAQFDDDPKIFQQVYFDALGVLVGMRVRKGRKRAKAKA